MVHRKQLLEDLKPLLKGLEEDLRGRCDEVAEIGAELKREYEQARAAGRCGVTFEEWRADLITQVAAAWILSCVFVRFLEDNALIAPPRVSGPLHGAGEGAGLMRARDEREHYFRSHATQTDRDYLLAVFDELARLPGTKDVFGPHNLVNAYRNWLSGDAAQKLIEFFQKIDADGAGELVHDFTDAAWDTRFLGDLYQDLSEAARKKYALLQTPIFVEEFILERTLEPAINEFGLTGFKMIDPACGSGHFVLGSFVRILDHWRRQEPGTTDRELVNRALAAVHGVDLNPYAVAIARFRLLLVAMRECQITKLKDAPAFGFNLVCGDSLLHGSPGREQQTLGFHELAHVYESEDLPELRRILTPGVYHAVVANPPYINPNDRSLNEAYRRRFTTCYRQYSLAMPFVERIFALSVRRGFTGQITGNSFITAEFGKKLIEDFLPKVDLECVVDASGVRLPGHGTPTVLLFGRQRPPVSPTIRAVLGIRGDSASYSEASDNKVWQSITRMIDTPGAENAFISVDDVPRARLLSHPWAIGGGGIANLKDLLDSSAPHTLESLVDSIGFYQDTHADEFFVQPKGFARRNRLSSCFRLFIRGDDIRDWCRYPAEEEIFFPYSGSLERWNEVPLTPAYSVLHCYRTLLWSRSTFGGDSYKAAERPWFDYHQFPRARACDPRAIAYAFVAERNHFTIVTDNLVFGRSAPLLRLKVGKWEQATSLLGILNSSTACFWIKQVCYPKGGDQAGKDGARVRTTLWDLFFNFNATPLTDLPLPAELPFAAPAALCDLSSQLLPRPQNVEHVYPAA